MRIIIDTKNKSLYVLEGTVKEFMREIRGVKDWEQYKFEEDDFPYPIENFSIN